MVNIRIDNLMRCDRPLTWITEPTCDRCSLPFTNSADELHNRLPLLLSCKHLLCGLCVREHSKSDGILCEHCNKYVPFPEHCDNVADELHPSYYMLGMMGQMQLECKHIEQYYKDECEKAQKDEDSTVIEGATTDFTEISPLTRDISTTKKMKTLLEEAFDSYEKAKHALDKRAQSYPENVGQVVQKINAHFLALHNALQIEQNGALQQVRKTYLVQQQHIEHQQQHLKAAKKRMIELHTRLKSFQGKSPPPDDETWLQFSGEVKTFLEKQPLKLSSLEGGSSERHSAVFYTVSGKFYETISTSYRLKLPDLSNAGQLVPFTTSARKHPQVVNTADNESCKTALLKGASSRERKLSDRSNHSVHAARNTISFNEPNTIPAREHKHSDGIVRATASSRKSSREKKRSKVGRKPHEPRTIHQADRAVLEHCFSTVTVTGVVNPHEIYVRDELLIEAAEKIVELCQHEAKQHEKKRLPAKHQLNVTVGAFYLVLPTNCANWYRAQVLEALNKTPEQLGPYKVQYVDYGGNDTVEIDQMRPMSDELSKIGCQAIRCSLYNIAPMCRTSTSWPAECYQLMMDFIGNRKMLLYEVEESAADGCRMVDMFLPPINATNATDTQTDVMSWEGYYPPMSLRTMLIHLQQCCEQQTVNHRNPLVNERLGQLKCWIRQATRQAQQRSTIPGTPVLAEYDFFDVRITHSKSPDCFYIMPMDWKTNRFDTLQKKLNAMCQKANAYKVFAPYKGLVCGFALDTDDGERVWLRGHVDKIVPGSCWMFALDTGESLKVSCNDLYLFPPESIPMSVHPLAVCCSLEHIRPKSVGDVSSWSEDAIEEFNMLMKSKTLRFAAMMGSLWNESKVYSVLLYLRNKADVDTCINKLLVAQGHAECIMGKEAHINDLMHKSNNRKVGDEVAPAPGTATITTEANNKVIDPRVPVDLLRVISPAEIYVRLSSRKVDLDGLHQTIQQHMDEALGGDMCESDVYSSELKADQSDWCPGDMCLVFTSPTDVHPIEWYRARITEVLEEGELYEAFLIDQALTVQVHRTNMARMVKRIAQLQPGAIRCHLACIEPLKGTAGWQQVTVDRLNNEIDSYEEHAISLDAKRATAQDDDSLNSRQSLSVVLWGVRVLPQQALAPQKIEYRNINQLLVVGGLAHLSGRFRTFATRGSEALEELQSVEVAIERMTRCEYEKLQEFFRTIAAVSAEAEGFGARESGNEAAEVVLKDEEMGARVEIDRACASVLTLVNDAVEPITEWPTVDPIEKTVFVGMPTHIGNDGTVFLYDMCQQPVLHRMRDTINEYVATSGLSAPAATTFKPGEPCLAKYHLDQLFYRGTVVAVTKRNKYRVLFVDYGNEEICAGEDLRKEVVCGRVPVQANRYRLSGIVPKQICKKTGTWPDDAIIPCHGLIVQQLCKVSVNTTIWSPKQDGQVRRPIPCTLFRLNDSVNVQEALLGLGCFTTQVEEEEESEHACDDATVPQVTHRHERVENPMTRVASPGTRSYSPTSYTPEQRDLMRFMEEIDASFDFNSYTKEYEDPNVLPEEPNSDYLNRAQLLNIDSDDRSDTSSEDTVQSPDNFNPSDLDSSTRLSADGVLDYQRDVLSGSETDPSPRINPFVSPIARNRTGGFFANFTNYGPDLTLHIFPHIEGHSQRMVNMESKIQQMANSQTELLRWQVSLAEVGEPCLAPYQDDGRYYRALIETVDEENAVVSVLYVDYLDRGVVPIAALRKCAKELRTIPLRNVEVRLKGVRRNLRMREDDIGQRMMQVLVQPFYVRILPSTQSAGPQPGETFKLEVELYSDYERGVLAYERMIEEGYLHAIVP